MNSYNRYLEVCCCTIVLSCFLLVTDVRASAESTYHEVWRTVLDHYYFDSSFDDKLWHDLEHKLDRTIITSPDETTRNIQVLLSDLGDPENTFLNPLEYEYWLRRQYCGIGVRIQQTRSKAHLLITQVLSGGAAEKAGVALHDELTHIDEVSCAGMTPEECKNRITGKKDTYVSLRLVHETRDGQHEIKTLRIARQVGSIPIVESRVLKERIGYVRLFDLNQHNVSVPFCAALRKLNCCSGIILDFRKTRGGLFSNGVNCASPFLPNGTMIGIAVYKKERRKITVQSSLKVKKPIVVLVNENTEGAVELMAAAVQENKRGTIIGTKTKGNNFGYEMIPISGGAGLKIRTLEWSMGDRLNIKSVGVIPDRVIPDRIVQLPDLQLQEALRLLSVPDPNHN